MIKAITSFLRIGALAALLSLFSAPALAEGGEAVHVSQAHWERVTAVAFSPDGKYAASGDWSGELIIWNVTDGSRYFSTKWGSTVEGLSFSPDSKDLFVAQNTTLARYSIKNKKRKDDTNTANQTSFAMSADGKHLAFGEIDSNDIHILKSKNFDSAARLTGHKDIVYSTIFSPDGKSIATLALDQKLVVWNPKDGTRKFQIRADENRFFRNAAFSPDSLHIAYTEKSGIHIASAKTGKLEREDFGSSIFDYDTYGNLEEIAYHPGGHMIATASSNGSIFLWDVATGNLLGELSGEHEGEVEVIAFSGDGSMLISGGFDSRIVIWKLD